MRGIGYATGGAGGQMGTGIKGVSGERMEQVSVHNRTYI